MGAAAECVLHRGASVVPTVVQLFGSRVFNVGVTKSAIRTPPIGTNRINIRAPAAAFRSAAGVGTSIILGVEISKDAGATWARYEAGYEGGGEADDNGVQTGNPIRDKHGNVIDYVEITAELGNTGNDKVPILSDAQTRVRAGVKVTGAAMTMGPGTATLD